MTTRTRLPAMAATVALAVGLVISAPAQGAPIPCRAGAEGRAANNANNNEIIRLRTLHVEMKPDKTSYRIGETAKIQVTVTRPAHEDPVGAGVEFEPPASMPADGVLVGIGLRVGDIFLPAIAMTDEGGLATVSIELRSYVPSGWASADGYAYKTRADTPCLTVQEDGYGWDPKLFKVIR